MPLLLKHHPLPFPSHSRVSFADPVSLKFILSLTLTLLHILTDPSWISFSASRRASALCHLLRVNLCRWSSGNPFGLLPPQYLLSRRSLIVIRSGCGAAQRWPMIAHPAILMLIACRLRATSNRRGSHNARQYLSLSICANDCSKYFLCNKD